ncbi:putative eka-like protein [Golovinomyces cichoracearum]|uniref:Putative eka-like protein n=1 Tax=Golovinomyces cichoracearum TaxID=62708 RepID=A0A420I8Z9_9PEZI|nr:putative eka-like protein [Golovinomyces cichoracearum]
MPRQDKSKPSNHKSRSHIPSHHSSIAQCIGFQMLPIRAKRHFTMVDIAKDRAPLREKNDEIPDIVMIDEHIDMLIAQGLKNSQWAPENTKESTPAVTFPVAGKLVTRENPRDLPDTKVEIDHQLARNNKVPGNQKEEVSSRIEQNASNIPYVVLRDIGCDKHGEVALKLRAKIQAEEQRAAQLTANLKSCTLAINGVQMTLSTSALDSNKEFNEGLLTSLRAAIAPFLENGTGIKPPVLPPKPKSNHQTVSHQQNKLSKIDSRTPEKTITVENSWATIARKGHQVTSQKISFRTYSINSEREIKRLFIHLPKYHEWRLLALSGIREAVSSHLKCSPADINHIRRTATSFALTAKDKSTRFRLLDGCVTLLVQNFRLEPASDLVTYHISTVPVAITSAKKKVLVTNSMLEAEIKRDTHSSLTSIRTHGKTKLGAPSQSWLAHFPRIQAPRPCFRFFDESGVAIL